MNENLKAFLQKASEDDVLGTKMAEINAAVMNNAKEKFIKLAEENGFTFTEGDIDHVTAESEKLNEDELNTVAGGAYSVICGDKSSKFYGKFRSDCWCAAGGGGTADDLQKTCACILAGMGDLTKLGREKAQKEQIASYDGAAMFCAIAGHYNGPIG